MMMKNLAIEWAATAYAPNSIVPGPIEGN